MRDKNKNPLSSATPAPLSLNPTKLSVEELISDIEYPSPTTPITISNTQKKVLSKTHISPTTEKPTKTSYSTCICKQSDFDCPPIECTCCHQPQHPICYGFFSPTDIRCKDFICLNCNKLGKQQVISSNLLVPSKVRMRKLIYFVYQINRAVKSTEIMEGCMMSKYIYSYTLASFNKRVNLNDLFEVSKKGITKFYNSKNDETSKKILMNIFNGRMDKMEDINLEKEKA